MVLVLEVYEVCVLSLDEGELERLDCKLPSLL